MAKKNGRTWAQKIWNESIGFLILILGVILIFPGVPGPGLLLIIIGLSLLAKDVRWARSLLEKAKEARDKAKEKTNRK